MLAIETTIAPQILIVEFLGRDPAAFQARHLVVDGNARRTSQRREQPHQQDQRQQRAIEIPVLDARKPAPVREHGPDTANRM